MTKKCDSMCRGAQCAPALADHDQKYNTPRRGAFRSPACHRHIFGLRHICTKRTLHCARRGFARRCLFRLLLRGTPSPSVSPPAGVRTSPQTPVIPLRGFVLFFILYFPTVYP